MMLAKTRFEKNLSNYEIKLKKFYKNADILIVSFLSICFDIFENSICPGQRSFHCVAEKGKHYEV